MLMTRSDSCRYIYKYKIMRSTKIFAQTSYVMAYLLAFCANLSFFKHGFLLNFCLRDIIPSIGRFYKEIWFLSTLVFIIRMDPLNWNLLIFNVHCVSSKVDKFFIYFYTKNHLLVDCTTVLAHPVYFSHDNRWILKRRSIIAVTRCIGYALFKRVP